MCIGSCWTVHFSEFYRDSSPLSYPYMALHHFSSDYKAHAHLTKINATKHGNNIKSIPGVNTYYEPSTELLYEVGTISFFFF